ncbi:MAG TPA: RDD family protein [Candidatus Saccharimonadales bacterium]|nr:RDD family protein [Candidatus Saccharimonadales bacterium]
MSTHVEPAPPQRAWRRRILAFLIDLGVAGTAADLLASTILTPVPAGLIALIQFLVFGAYWAAFEASRMSTTPGKSLMGLRVVGTDGMRPRLPAVLVRALFMALLFGGDLTLMLGRRGLGLLPDAYAYAEIGLAAGYTLAALLVARRWPDAELLHDRWSRTRVVRQLAPVTASAGAGVAEAGAAEAAMELARVRSRAARIGGAVIAASALVAVAIGLGLAPGNLAQRILGTGPRGFDVERWLERRIVARTGVRSTVSMSFGARWVAGQPTVHFLRLVARLPLFASDSATVRQAFTAMTESLVVDPRRYDQLEIQVGAWTSGVLGINRRTTWTFEQDPRTRNWRLKGSDRGPVDASQGARGANAPGREGGVDPASVALDEALAYASGTAGRVDYGQALALARQASTGGSAAARFWLAACTEQGYPEMARDTAQARRMAATGMGDVWRQADAGSAPAQYVAGLCRELGLGCRRDDREAVGWYRKAAEQGLTRAMVSLAHMYSLGQGVPRNYNQALEWGRKAADRGDASAMAGLASMFHTGQGVARDDQEAVAWSRQGAGRGNVQAMVQLGWMYEHGSGVKPDPAQSVAWYRKAARLGYQEARDYLDSKGVGW